MVFAAYKELKENRKPGDRVFGVRREAFVKARMDQWPEIHPVEGTLQSSYYDNPKNGPHPPRHLAPAAEVEGHPWDDAWWNVEDWVICDTLQEAEAELEKQMRAAIAKAKEQILSMEFLLPSVKTETRNDNGEFDIPPVYRCDMSVTLKEVMSHCYKKEHADTSIGNLFTMDEFRENVNCGGISDYDGSGDLVIDGYTYDNVYIWCDAARVLIGDMFEIPFERLDQIFEGHELKVLWYNK